MFLEIENLVVNYGRRPALDGFSLKLDSSSAGLLGPNGAGKSTLIRTLLGFQRPTSGTARVMGFDCVKESHKIKRMIGYMPENESFIIGQSAVRMLRYLGELAGLPARDAMERTHEMLYYVGMGEERYRPIETLSLGNQQRVKLAAALVHGPRVLILDEPTNALDPDGRQEMLRLIRDVTEVTGSHIIMCSHILPDVEYCCKDVCVINKGKVILTGSINELKKEDKRTFDIRVNARQEAFLSALANRGWHCNENDRGIIRVTLPEGASTLVFFEIAKELGIQLRHFYHKKDSLEDIFVSAIEESEKRPIANASS